MPLSPKTGLARCRLTSVVKSASADAPVQPAEKSFDSSAQSQRRTMSVGFSADIFDWSASKTPTPRSPHDPRNPLPWASLLTS